MRTVQNRRRFLAGLSAAGAAGLVARSSPAPGSELSPETTVIRLPA